MNKLILILCVCVGLAACGGNGADDSGIMRVQRSPQDEKDRVEVLCFHSKRRCATCRAIEKNAREAVEARFAEELENGTVVFRSIDISKPENEGIAGRYGVTWSALFVSKWSGGEETCENMTQYAFANARTAPEKFRSGVVEKVEAFLR